MEREHLPGTLKLWPGVAEELVGAKAYFIRAGLFSDVDVVAVRPRRRQSRRRLGRRVRHRARVGRVHVQGRERARRRRAVARPVGARRGRADGRRLEFPPRASAAAAALAQRHHRTAATSRTSCRRPRRVWYYFRETDYAHIKEMCEIGDTMAKAAAMMTDTEVTSRILGVGVAAAHEQDRRRSDVREHPDGRPADVGRRGLRRWPRRSRRS